MGFSYPVLSRFGLEFTFSTHLQTSQWLAFIRWGDGTDVWEAVIEYDYVNKQLEYLGIDGLMHVFGIPVNTQTGTQPDSTMKMVVDLSLGHYVRVIFNSYEMTLLNIECNTWGAVAAPIIGITIRHVSVPGQNPIGYIDNVIVTQNEP